MLAGLRSEQYGYTLRRTLADHGIEIEEGTLYLLAAVSSARPFWTPLRSRVRLVVDASSLTLTGFLLAAGPPWIELLVPSLPAKVAEIARLNNQIFFFVLLAVLVIQAVRIALDVRRIMRQRATPAGGLTAAGGSIFAG